ncbi:hypothetical protein FM036_13130 [Nostoc sp. HG1]|nr:hypothetical protein [Nostoc sp. HG1]
MFLFCNYLHIICHWSLIIGHWSLVVCKKLVISCPLDCFLNPKNPTPNPLPAGEEGAMMYLI